MADTATRAGLGYKLCIPLVQKCLWCFNQKLNQSFVWRISKQLLVCFCSLFVPFDDVPSGVVSDEVTSKQSWLFRPLFSHHSGLDRANPPVSSGNGSACFVHSVCSRYGRGVVFFGELRYFGCETNKRLSTASFCVIILKAMRSILQFVAS